MHTHFTAREIGLLFRCGRDRGPARRRFPNVWPLEMGHRTAGRLARCEGGAA